jgi:hypothetical protein
LLWSPGSREVHSFRFGALFAQVEEERDERAALFPEALWDEGLLADLGNVFELLQLVFKFSDGFAHHLHGLGDLGKLCLRLAIVDDDLTDCHAARGAG